MLALLLGFEANTTGHDEKLISALGAFLGISGVYSNDQLGQRWSVRQVIDAADSGGSREKIIYKTVAGAGAYETGICSKEDFRLWARFEVAPSNGHWLRLADAATAPDTVPADDP